MTDDSSFLSLGSTKSTNESCVGPPPVDFDSTADDSSEVNNFEVTEDAYDRVFEGIGENNFERTTEQIVTDSKFYTNQTIQTLLSACLTVNGVKLKTGYTAEEICECLKDMMGVDLEYFTIQLLGRKKAERIAINKNKIELAHALVHDGWLRTENRLFFPIIPKQNEALVAQFIVGAESLERFKEKKQAEQNQFSSKEDELRAMNTYNMLVKLITQVCNKTHQPMLPYQMILDAYQKMLSKDEYKDIYDKYEPILKLSEHGMPNTTWYKHYTGRSSLIKFCSMSIFSGIVCENVTTAKFGIRKNATLFKRSDFDEVEQKYDNPNGRKPSFDYSRKEKKEKKPIEPDPSYKPVVLDEDDDDYDDFKSTTSKAQFGRQESRPTRNPIHSGFGGPEQVAPPNDFDSSSASEKANKADDMYSDISTESSMTDGEYTDESEGTKRMREEKIKKKKLRKEMRERKQANRHTVVEPAKPNRFHVSTFGGNDNEEDEEDEEDEKRSEKPTTSRPRSSKNDLSSDSETIDRRSQNSKFSSNARLPMTLLDNDTSIMADASKKPPFPHEPAVGVKERLKAEEEMKLMKKIEESRKKELLANEETKNYLEFKKNEAQREAERLQILNDEKMARDLQREMQSTTIEPRQKENWSSASPSPVNRHKQSHEDQAANHSNRSTNEPRIEGFSNPPPQFSAQPNNRSAFDQPKAYRPTSSTFQDPRYQNEPEFTNYERPRRHEFNPNHSSDRHTPPMMHSGYAPSYANDSHYVENRMFNNHRQISPPASSYVSAREHHGGRYSRMGGMGPSRIGASRYENSSVHHEVNDDLIQRVYRFIHEFEIDGYNVTDTEFHENFPYKYKLPRGFNLAEFVDRYLSHSIRITRVNVQGISENLYNVRR